MSNASERLMRVRSSLVLTQPFFGALALRLRVIEDPKRTAHIATDGRSLVYNPKFIDTVSDAQLKFLVCHLIMHCAAGHPWRRDARDNKVWNKACDAAINPILKDAGFELTQDSFYRKDLDGKSAEQAYSTLLQEEPPSGGGQGQGQGGGGKKKKQPQGGGQGQDEGQGDGQGEGEGQSDGPPDEGQAPGSVMDGGTADGANAKEEETQWKIATSQAAQTAKLQGKLPGSLERLIEENARSKVDWKSTLRRFMQQVSKNDYSWRRPRARYMASGTYLPEMYSESMPPIVVVVDTSGSIGEKELALFGGEIDAIVKECNPELTHVVYCDARVNHTDEFLPGDDIKLKPYGGGGTSFKPPFKWVDNNDVEPACLIYLTDMYGDFPDEAPAYPTIWCSTTEKMDAPFGEVLYLGDDWVNK